MRLTIVMAMVVLSAFCRSSHHWEELWTASLGIWVANKNLALPVRLKSLISRCIDWENDGPLVRRTYRSLEDELRRQRVDDEVYQLLCREGFEFMGDERFAKNREYLKKLKELPLYTSAVEKPVEDQPVWLFLLEHTVENRKAAARQLGLPQGADIDGWSLFMAYAQRVPGTIEHFLIGLGARCHDDSINYGKVLSFVEQESALVEHKARKNECTLSNASNPVWLNQKKQWDALLKLSLQNRTPVSALNADTRMALAKNYEVSQYYLLLDNKLPAFQRLVSDADGKNIDVEAMNDYVKSGKNLTVSDLVKADLYREKYYGIVKDRAMYYHLFSSQGGGRQYAGVSEAAKLSNPFM